MQCNVDRNISFSTLKILNEDKTHRYTYYALEFLERVTPNSKKTMGEFLKVCPKRVCISTVGTRTDLFR